ncbi:helix-turn-helix domain-containing protein [Streptomyces sp. NPDC020607]|uniref:GbsR/MarR family transcriptional regulator n=1 Tax=Streptomyces sp. NPDC020607 TaxID=3365082 RepID=UPI0037B270A6
MGGGRLSAEDRRAIEAGLSEELSYAAIARRLGRATSSVSREVARNGGPDAYRAEHADRADAWRRRNRLPPPRRPTGTPPADARTTAAATAGKATHGPDPAAVDAYVDKFAALLIAVGLPRTAARVLACLVTAPAGAETSAELTRRLKVSPASVSKAVGYLEGLDVLSREHEPGRRRDRYVIDEEVWLRAWLTSAHKNAACAATALEGADLFGPDTPTGARLGAMHAFFAGIHRSMTGPPARAAVEDALTVLTALFHAARPLTTSELATALGWPTSRVITAVQAAGHDHGVRLSPEQRARLTGPTRPPAADPPSPSVAAGRPFSRPASS